MGERIFLEGNYGRLGCQEQDLGKDGPGVGVSCLSVANCIVGT